jgi:hypothetical protein
MTTLSRTTTQGKDQHVVDGIQQELQSFGTMHLGAQAFTPQTLAAFVQQRIDLANAIATAKAAWDNAIAVYESADARTDLVLADLRNLVIGAFGRESPALASFGFVAPKRPVLTPEQRARAALKAKATRKARRTMGKKQKALVKGAAPEVS